LYKYFSREAGCCFADSYATMRLSLQNPQEKSMKTVIPSVKGTRDFYPGEMAARTWLYNKLRKVSESFGYQEYEGPILETIDLYAAKSSEELVKEQAFSFQDRGGDWITMRPELTPTLARMIALRQAQLVYPLRWWSFGPFWRYEKPQKGRTREFFQWNIDQIGVDSPETDAETVAIVASLFHEVGLTPQQAVILVNDRKLTNGELEKLGVTPEQRQSCLTWIDRRDKLAPEAWEAYGQNLGLSAAQIEGTKAFLERPDLWQESETLQRTFAALEALGVKEYVRYDSGIIRGLPYYTGLVFEAFDVSGSVRRAIMGGGRYNNLMAAVGGDPMPAVGFAMGDVVISLILKELGLLPAERDASSAAVLVTMFDAERMPASLNLSARLRQAGLNVAIYPEPAKLPKQFKYADRMGMRVAVVIGPDEAAAGQATVKDLQAGTQATLPQAQVAEAIRAILTNA
jgi:histidyl-tRNA synthetase